MAGVVRADFDVSRVEQSVVRIAAELESQLQQSQDALRAAQRKKYLLVVINWNTRDDVDLHIADPAGREFYYGRKTHPRTPAKLEEDNTSGPGNEIWLHPEVTPGEYKIHYKLFGRRTRLTQVRGLILHPNGRREIPTRRLERESEKPLVAVIQMDADGNPTVRLR